jgi:hypothetical protein
MKKVVIILFLFTSSLCSFGQSQLFYACTSYKGLLKLDVRTCDTTFIGSLPSIFGDIALTPDGKLYGLSLAMSRNLYEIDTSNASIHLIAALNFAGSNSLVSDSAGNLLTVSQDSVYQINRFTGQIFSLGYFGAYASAGDLTFYQDTLYLTAIGNLLIKIILHPVVSSQLVGTMSATNIYGINTICLNGSETMIASGGDNRGSSLYTVNPTNALLTLLCDTITHHTLIYGATSQRDFITREGCFVLNGINVPSTDDNLNIFPNPVTDILNISYNNAELIVITIFDVASKQLLCKMFMNSVSLNIENLSAGVYLFQIENAEGIIKRGKFLKSSD